MFAIAVIEENLELIAGLNEGARPLVEVPNAYFVYTDEETPTFIMPAIDFEAIAMHDNVPTTTVTVWTI